MWDLFSVSLKQVCLITFQHDDSMMLRFLFTKNPSSFLALLIACLCSLVIVLRPIFDYDLYWHLANGREMVQSGKIISEEVFSFTHFGEKFENHEWLAQIIFYLIWQAAGLFGLLGLKLLITTLIVLLGYNTARTMGGSPWMAALLCVLAVLAGVSRYAERPELFSLLNVALISFILYGYRAGRLSRKTLWFIPLIMVVWNSLHGAVYGLVFLSLFVAGENIKHFVPVFRCEPADGQATLKALNQCLALTMLVLLIDPFGLRSYSVFFNVFDDNKEHSLANFIIMEYMPLTVLWREFIPFICMLAWAVLMVVRHVRRIDISQLLPLLFFGALSVKYSRVTGVTSIMLIPTIASLMTVTAIQQSGRFRQALATAIMLLATAFVSGYGYMVKFSSMAKPLSAFGYQPDERFFPVGSVRLAKALGLRGNYYNTGNFGGYLSFFMAPEHKIFQYNISTIFGDPTHYISHPDELAHWNINYAFVSRPDELAILFPTSHWAPIYREPAGTTLVLRRTPQNQELIRQFELHFFYPTDSTDELYTLAQDARILPRLTEEIGIYLAFHKDQRIADFWAEILAANSDLREHPRIQALLQQALKFNDSGKLVQQVIRHE